MQNKILIAIISCKRDIDNGFNDAIRDTWIRHIPEGVDYKFIIGQNDGLVLKDDEVMLPCPDDYNNLPYKTKALLEWALVNDYDFVYKCDTDTYLMPDRLINSGFHNFDYVGHFNGPIGQTNTIYGCLYSWTSGGSGYCLSKKAMQIVVSYDASHMSMCPVLQIPCEDLWVGQLLGEHIENGKILANHNPRFASGFNKDFICDISTHYCSEGNSRKFDVNWLYNHEKINRPI